MTKISMHAATAPLFARMLHNLDHILEKGEAHAKAKNIDPSTMLNARLAADMMPLTRQIQIAADHAKGTMARLAGQTSPVIEDNETTFAQLRERIRRTIDIVQSMPASALEGAEDREIVINLPNMELKFTGLDFMLQWAYPNFFFHVTTAYAILRHHGVELGKRDFLAG